MLRAPEGASFEEITAATGWQSHTVRGAMAGALKKKLALVSDLGEGRGARAGLPAPRRRTRSLNNLMPGVLIDGGHLHLAQRRWQLFSAIVAGDNAMRGPDMPLREVEYYLDYAYYHANGTETEVAKTHPILIQPRKKIVNLDFVVDIQDLSHGFVCTQLNFGGHSERLYLKMSLGEATRLLSP
jgi:hypothetical protein